MSRRPPEHPRPKTVPSRGVAKRLEIEVLPTDVAVIRQVAALTGQTTLAAVMRDALKAYAWMVREQYRNRRIISEDRERGDRVELMPVLKLTAL
jgi:hypothetical protein